MIKYFIPPKMIKHFIPPALLSIAIVVIAMVCASFDQPKQVVPSIIGDTLVIPHTTEYIKVDGKVFRIARISEVKFEEVKWEKFQDFLDRIKLLQYNNEKPNNK